MAPNDPRERDVAGRLALVTGRIGRRIRGASEGLSSGLLSALASIHKLGPIRLAELAQLESVSPPSTTRLVADLERRGLVRRSVDPLDGRAFLIEVTAAGSATVLAARSKRAFVVGELLSRLDPEDIAAIAAALPALERAIDNEDQLPARRP